MSDPQILRDFRVVTVRINPVQVNPVTRQARIYRDVQVEVVPNDQPGVNKIQRVRRPSGLWAPAYQQLIENLDESALDDATTTPGTYMIFAKDNSTVNPWTDSLALWKKRSGHDVLVVRQANWSNTQIIDNSRRLAGSSRRQPAGIRLFDGRSSSKLRLADFGRQRLRSRVRVGERRRRY